MLECRREEPSEISAVASRHDTGTVCTIISIVVGWSEGMCAASRVDVLYIFPRERNLAHLDLSDFMRCYSTRVQNTTPSSGKLYIQSTPLIPRNQGRRMN